VYSSDNPSFTCMNLFHFIKLIFIFCVTLMNLTKKSTQKKGEMLWHHD
jgi:hypothetical protein